jgi:hypothetical protein
MQNLLKILPSMSSVVTSPVISPRESSASLISNAKNSGDSPVRIASRKDLRLRVHLSSASLCLSSLSMISLLSERFLVCMSSSRILSFSSSIPVPSFAEVLIILFLCICAVRSFSAIFE